MAYVYTKYGNSVHENCDCGVGSAVSPYALLAAYADSAELSDWAVRKNVLRNDIQRVGGERLTIPKDVLT